jgi:mannose-6-phosphate isomerase-like protein (cupin superfamily)
MRSNARLVARNDGRSFGFGEPLQGGRRYDMPIDPSLNYLQLRQDGSIEVLKGGMEFWAQPGPELARQAEGRLVTESVYTQDWPTWEMHPQGDELVYLLEGAVDFVLEGPEGTTTVPLRERGLVVVPRGVWHTAKVLAPSRLFFVTAGAGTQIRGHDGALRTPGGPP